MKLQLVPQAYAQCNPGQGGIDLGNCLQLAGSTPVQDLYNNPAFLVNLIVRNLFILAGVLLTLTIFMAGYKFVSKGKEGIQEGKQMVTNAMVGFLIMFAAYWIVQIIALLTGADISL